MLRTLLITVNALMFVVVGLVLLFMKSGDHPLLATFTAAVAINIFQVIAGKDMADSQKAILRVFSIIANVAYIIVGVFLVYLGHIGKVNAPTAAICVGVFFIITACLGLKFPYGKKIPQRSPSASDATVKPIATRQTGLLSNFTTVSSILIFVLLVVNCLLSHDLPYKEVGQLAIVGVIAYKYLLKKRQEKESPSSTAITEDPYALQKIRLERQRTGVLPEEFNQSVPRPVRVQGSIKAMLVTLVIACLFMSGQVLFMAYPDIHKKEILKTHGNTVEGYITDLHVEGQPPHDYHYVSYHFKPSPSADNQSFTGKDRELVRDDIYPRLQVGQAVPIVYDPSDPSNSSLNIDDRIHMANSHMDMVLFLPALFPIVMFGGLVIWGWKKYDKEKKLVEKGGLAVATITGESEYDVGHGRRSLAVTYEFTDASGKIIQGIRKALPLRSDQNKKSIELLTKILSAPAVIYDPQNSDDNILYPPTYVTPQFSGGQADTVNYFRSSFTVVAMLALGTLIGSGQLKRFIANSPSEKAASLMRQGQNDQAVLDLLNQAVAKNPTSVMDLSNRGMLYAKMGKFDLALNDFNQASILKPDDSTILGNRGAVYTAKEDFDPALNDFNEAIRISPDNPRAFAGRAGAETGKGLYEQAINDLNKAVGMEPGLPILGLRGEVYLAQDEYAKAIQDFSQAIQSAPNDPDLFYSRGRANLYNNDNTQAINDFTKAVSLDTASDSSAAYHVIWLHIAHIHASQNDEQEFERNSSRFVDPQWPTPVMALYQGKSSAEEVYEKAKTGDEKTQHAQTCEANFYTGELYLQKNMKDDAKKSFRQQVTTVL